jgi:hypothetical protein
LIQDSYNVGFYIGTRNVPRGIAWFELVRKDEEWLEGVRGFGGVEFWVGCWGMFGCCGVVFGSKGFIWKLSIVWLLPKIAVLSISLGK